MFVTLGFVRAPVRIFYDGIEHLSFPKQVSMSKIVKFFKDFFGRTDSQGEVSHEELRAFFRSRYKNFKTILNANSAVLQIMSDMEHAVHGGYSFGMAFIRAGYGAITDNVYKMIQNVNAISSHRYEELYDVFENIRDAINGILKEPTSLSKGELILPLETVNKEMIDQVGSKMANLGEIKTRLGFPVPEGFVVTDASKDLFMSHGQLQKKIEDRLQSLDPDDMAMLQKASTDIQQMILQSSVPESLDHPLRFAYERLDEKTGGRRINVSLRTSILGEDETRVSCAGHYQSLLNVGDSHIAYAYKEALATKYAPEALTYRLHAGFRDEDIGMSVGVMAMVDAAASGVVYSRDPGNIRRNIAVVHAIWGLPKPVLDGSVPPDVFVVSRKAPGRVLKKEIRAKGHQFVCLPEEGICRLETAGTDRDAPSVTDDEAIKLADLAIKLETYYGSPQEIEWSIEKSGHIMILHVRPVRITGTAASLRGVGRRKIEQPVLVKGGWTASPGVATGPAVLVNNALDFLRFPQGAVLVTRYSLPRWAAILNRAAAVVTDFGSISGDLAMVCMELEIPALFNTLGATENIQEGDVVTVDAEGRRVYSGVVDTLLAEVSAPKANPMKGSPAYHTLHKVLEFIAPLNLTDPESREFAPQGCKTLHDISRLCYEKSVKEMFGFGKHVDFPERTAKQLICEIPMKWWIMDLHNGFKEPVEGDTVPLEHIACLPMLAIWEGITAVPWKGPPPVDTRGLLSVMFRSTRDPSLVFTRRSPYAEKNYFMISRHFCDLTCRFGYHLASAQAFINERAEENYVAFGYKGGGADFERRVLRLRLIEQILKTFGFRTQVERDVMNAQIEGYDSDFLIERLKVLGYLIMHTRQLDMVMTNKGAVKYYINEFLKDIDTFLPSKH
jgi:pyruvate,water dikinase